MNKKILSINIFSFFVALHYALIVYYGSTFLAKSLGTSNVWMIYSLGALLTISLNLIANKLFHKININKLVPTFSILAVLNLIILFAVQSFTWDNAFLQNIFIGFNFALYIAFAQSLFTLTSVMLEDLSKDSKTGSLRGALLSITNTGYLIAPFIAKIILQNGGQDKYLFLFSAIICFATYFIFHLFIKNLPEISIHENTNFKKDLKAIWHNIDVRNIILAQIAIEVFYASFVIYMPQKLIPLDIPLSTYLGIIIPVALIPFMFLPAWLGHLEDRVSDERHILLISFTVLTLILTAFGLIHSSSIFLWGFLIFMSRVCSAAIETSTSSYLFKKINVKNTTTITLFGSAQPIAYFIAPIVFGLVYYFTKNVDYVFIFSAFLMFYMLHVLCEISDTENNKDKENIKQKVQDRFSKILRTKKL
jgi:MFS family permease